MHLQKSKLLLIGSIITLSCFCNKTANADWQKTLEGSFDIVETFDDLKDWKGYHNNQVTVIDNPSDMPVKSDGSPSIWQYYYLSSTPTDIKDYWIKNHGSSNVWRGTGKSAVIDYNAAAPEDVRGPNRLGFKIGSSPSDGYPDEIYVFYMMKIPKDFFKTTGSSFDYHKFVKTLDISAGFETVRIWGTESERNWLYNNCPAPYPKSQVISAYGLNAQVYNFHSFNGIEALKATVLTPSDDLGYCHYGESVYRMEDSEISTEVLNDSWVGIEYRIKTSNPHGAANGVFESWTYDASGKILGHELVENVVSFKDGLTKYNHAWNRFVWGGNRFDGTAYCGDSGPGCEFGPAEHYFIDDVIINGKRIGPAYFSLLQGTLIPPIIKNITLH